MAVDAGAMRHRITIQQRSTSTGSTGGRLNSWTTFANRWASMKRVTGEEIVAGAQRAGRVPTVWRMRYVPGLLPAMRIRFGSEVYDIKSAVDERGLREEHVVTAELHVEESP